MLHDQLRAFNPEFDIRNLAGLLDPAHAITEAWLEGFALPPLFFIGGYDRSITPEAPRMMAGTVPGAGAANFPESGHSLYWEESARNSSKWCENSCNPAARAEP